MIWKWLHWGVVGFLVVVNAATILLLFYHHQTSETLWWRIVDGDVQDARAHYHERELFFGNEIGVTDILNSEEFDAANSRRGGKTFLYTWGTLTTRRHQYSESTSRRFYTRYFQFGVSTWFVSILTAIYPAIFYFRSYRRRRVRRQALHPCSQCGYDLQGNESGVCPECGERVASSSTTEVAG